MTTPALTYDLSLLDRSLAKWQDSPALRAVYADIFAGMRGQLAPGSVLEVGSGIGMARDYFPGVVLSDILPTRYVDRAVSAYEIPRENWGNIIATDMLHHLQEPLRFLESAAAALAPGGRIVLAEPAGTAWGRIFYGWFHHEPCRPEDVPRNFRFAADPDGAFANMGMAYALFDRERAAVAVELRRYGLGLVSVRYRDLLAYPATGGFSRSALLPAGLLRGLLAAERVPPQVLMRFLALRMIIVLEKNGPA
jgi:SAM-dependent methyltransferase